LQELDQVEHSFRAHARVRQMGRELNQIRRLGRDVIDQGPVPAFPKMHTRPQQTGISDDPPDFIGGAPTIGS
jgi:hypothetical protein